MRVSSLQLNGFKSFADPTLLELDAGVTVIVGPNGSGKSNVADALAWVLGAQAPSTLRGASMEDVVFAGSERRPRLGIAEVEITLDNSSRALPIDAAEVTIGRSMDRSGTSEYRINGAPCRLLDITELLSDTGIGRTLHAVVGQGQLEQVLNARPEDRRTFIEEAAQIGKYRRRKDRSLRKIERVDENLTRLHDVLEELRRALRPLRRQARAAAQYSELLSEHTQLRQKVAATEMARLQSEGLSVDRQVHGKTLTLLSDELAHVRAVLATATGERHALAAKADRARGVAHRLARSTDRLQALGRLAQQRIETLEARLAAETEEGYRERIRLLEHDRARWESESRRLGEVATGARRRASEAHEHAARAAAERQRAEGALSEARTAENEAARVLVRAEGSEAAGRTGLQASEARLASVSERRDVAARRLSEAARAVATAENEAEALQRRLDEGIRRAAEAEAAVEHARGQLERVRAASSLTHAGRAAALARTDALEEVSAAVSDIPGALERITPLLVAAREQASIASMDDDRAGAALHAARAEVERLERVAARHDDEVRGLDALVAGAAERLGGARRRYEAIEIELAGLDDELARVREALAEAQMAAAEQSAVLPGRRSALERARAAHAQAESEAAAATELAAGASARATELELEARTAEDRALAAQHRYEEAEAGIGEAREALAGLQARRDALVAARRRAERVAAIALLASERALRWSESADARAAAAREAADASERRVESLTSRERELSDRLDEVKRHRSEAEVRRAELRTRSDALAERAMEEWGMSVDSLLAMGPLVGSEEREARERIEELDRHMRRLGAVNPHAGEEYEELAERERFLEAQIEDLRSSRRDLMKIVREVDETITSVFSDAFADVAREFEVVFARLFPGGHGSLRLVDPDDVLASGVEVEARPPGKNVKKLSLLSGGERALVALAFLFALFRSRPSPFYLLDEVEAALDDINLQRFLGLVRELQHHAQVLIVTHQKRTMEIADVLYGVSMSKDGVSRVVAKRMEQVPVV